MFIGSVPGPLFPNDPKLFARRVEFGDLIAFVDKQVIVAGIDCDSERLCAIDDTTRFVCGGQRNGKDGRRELLYRTKIFHEGRFVSAVYIDSPVRVDGQIAHRTRSKARQWCARRGEYPHPRQPFAYIDIATGIDGHTTDFGSHDFVRTYTRACREVRGFPVRLKSREALTHAEVHVMSCRVHGDLIRDGTQLPEPSQLAFDHVRRNSQERFRGICQIKPLHRIAAHVSDIDAAGRLVNRHR